MPTVFAHALVGAAVGRVAPGTLPAGRLAAVCALAAVIPDADVVAFALGIPYEHALGHRGATHGVAFAAACGLIGAQGFRTDRWRAGLLIALAMASHGLLDALTNGGLGVAFAWPVSSERFFFPWRPIQVSPIGVRNFFQGDAWRVIASELRVIVPLCAMLFALGFVLRPQSPERC